MSKKLIDSLEDRYAFLLKEDEDIELKESRAYLRKLVNNQQLNQK